MADIALYSGEMQTVSTLMLMYMVSTLPVCRNSYCAICVNLGKLLSVSVSPPVKWGYPDYLPYRAVVRHKPIYTQQCTYDRMGQVNAHKYCQLLSFLLSFSPLSLASLCSACQPNPIIPRAREGVKVGIVTLGDCISLFTHLSIYTYQLRIYQSQSLELE